MTSDILLKFALAFGFGFGFDKVFESWNKAPREKPNTKENEQQKTDAFSKCQMQLDDYVSAKHNICCEADSRNYGRFI